MRICYAYDVAFPNGFAATIQILRTGEALARMGNDFDLACGRVAGSPEEVWRALGIDPPERLRLMSLFPDRPRLPLLRAPLLRRRMTRHLTREAPDVVVSRGETGIALLQGAQPAPRILEVHKLCSLERAERAAGTRVDPADIHRVRASRAEARAFRAADGLLYLTPGVREAAEAAFGPLDAPSAIVPSGTAIPPEHRPEGPPACDLIYVGKIERRKGLFLMLEAMRHLPERTLRLIGDGADLEAGRDHAARHGLSDRVRFAGRVPHAAVAEELARARVGLALLPDDVDHISAAFTSPMKLLEMMATGLAVVATDLPSVRNLCRSGVDAVLVPPDPVAIAAAIEALLRDPPAMARLGAAARRRAAAFAWEARAERIAALCEEARATWMPTASR